MMKKTVKEIADILNSSVLGNDATEIHGLASFEDAGPRDIAFASGVKYLKKLRDTGAGAVIVPLECHSDEAMSLPDTVILSEHPKRDFFRLLPLFYPCKVPEKNISPTAVIGSNFTCGINITVGHHVCIGDDVSLGDEVEIMAGAFVGDSVVIGAETLIKPNVTIMERTIIGKRVIIHSGTVIGSDGYGFTQPSQPDYNQVHNNGEHEKISHAGFVQIDDDVEIGACNTIDRGTLGKTWLKKGVKTDNQIHIAHNVTIGEHTLLIAQVGIAGSTIIGKNVIIAGKAGISGHLKIGDGAIVGPGAGVVGNVAPGIIVSGIPEMPHKLWLKVGKIIPRLPDLRKKLRSLEKKIISLEKILKNRSQSNDSPD